MKYLLLILLFLITLNCSGNKVTNSHGYNFISSKYDKIVLNRTNKNDLRKLIGPPSSKSDFKDMWIYIERKKTNQSLINLGKQKIKQNNVLIISFNENGTASNKKILDLNDMNDLEFAEKVTEKKFSQNNIVYNIFSTLREKINAPTRNRKK